MPGAPNRPPETKPGEPAAPPAPEPPDRKVLRRLAPSRVALLLDGWKGAPSPDLIGPFDRAEAAYSSADYPAAGLALDQLSVRFAEPRWPTLPEPFRSLRVPIPAPMPPHWNPEHALAAAEKETLRARRVADEQLALARGSVAWAAAHGVPVADVAPEVESAAAKLAEEGPGAAFYEKIDAVWEAVRARLPRPKAAAGRPAPTASEPTGA